MTQYCYLDEMQNLCLRLNNAFKVIRPKDTALIDLYDSAEEGFFRKKEKCPVTEAGVSIPEEKLDRVAKFRAFVIKAEEEAEGKINDNDAEAVAGGGWFSDLWYYFFG